MVRPPDPSMVMRSTLAAALVPGLGHLFQGRRFTALLLFLAAAFALGLAAVQLLVGFDFFDASLGSFLLGTVLRNAAVLHTFSVMDVYLFGVDPEGEHHPIRRRNAVILNVLLPGLGYLYIGAWVRMVTGVLLDVVFFYFARAGHHPYLDIIFIGMQLIMGATVYRQVRIQEGTGGGDMLAAANAVEKPPLGPPPTPVQGAQVVALVVGVLAIIWVGVVVQMRMLPSEITGLSMDDIVVRQTKEGVDFQVSSLGLSMSAVGKGWTASEDQSGSLFRAVHQAEADFRVGLQLIPPFMDVGRFMARLRRLGEDQGYKHQKTLDLELGGYPATQLRFTGSFSYGDLDFWTVAVPMGRYAYVIMITCRKESCAALSPQLERTRDSFLLSQ